MRAWWWGVVLLNCEELRFFNVVGTRTQSQREVLRLHTPRLPLPPRPPHTRRPTDVIHHTWTTADDFLCPPRVVVSLPP